MLFIKNENNYTKTAHHDLLVGSVNYFNLTDKLVGTYVYERIVIIY